MFEMTGCGHEGHPYDCDCDVEVREPVPIRPIDRDSTIGQILDQLVSERSEPPSDMLWFLEALHNSLPAWERAREDGWQADDWDTHRARMRRIRSGLRGGGMMADAYEDDGVSMDLFGMTWADTQLTLAKKSRHDRPSQLFAFDALDWYRLDQAGHDHEGVSRALCSELRHISTTTLRNLLGLYGTRHHAA